MKHLRRYNEGFKPEGVISLSQFDFDNIYFNTLSDFLLKIFRIPFFQQLSFHHYYPLW